MSLFKKSVRYVAVSAFSNSCKRIWQERLTHRVLQQKLSTPCRFYSIAVINIAFRDKWNLIHLSRFSCFYTRISLLKRCLCSPTSPESQFTAHSQWTLPNIYTTFRLYGDNRQTSLGIRSWNMLLCIRRHTILTSTYQSLSLNNYTNTSNFQQKVPAHKTKKPHPYQSNKPINFKDSSNIESQITSPQHSPGW